MMCTMFLSIHLMESHLCGKNLDNAGLQVDVTTGLPFKLFPNQHIFTL